LRSCKHKLEGIVSKRAAAPYRSRRTEDWLKLKCLSRQEFVIGGWMASDKPGRELAQRLAKIERDTPPFAAVPRAYQRSARWVDPCLVAEVTFTTWTADNLLRHPSFQGLREDKPAKDVKLERQRPAKRS
jgi:bifunctional non-homologous end joining protein LigD